MKKLRIFLVNILIGDSSYIRNVVVHGSIIVRKDHYITCCSFDYRGSITVGATVIPVKEAIV
jgi:hypothetical protein